MIILGESILSVILIELDENEKEKYLIENICFGVMWFIKSFGVFFMYFRGKNAHKGDHALNRGYGILWCLLHYVMACCLLANSVAIKYAVEIDEKDDFVDANI